MQENKQAKQSELQNSLKASEDKVTQLQSAVSKLESASRLAQDSLAQENLKVQSQLTEIKALQLEKSQLREDAKRKETELQKERDEAQDQLSQFLNQTTSEKSKLQSKEEQFRQTLTQTLEQLNRKEEECKQEHERVKGLEVEKDVLNGRVRELSAQVEQLTQRLGQIGQSQTEEEHKLSDLQATLESNRDLISMLRNELQKSIVMASEAKAEVREMQKNKILVEEQI